MPWVLRHLSQTNNQERMRPRPRLQEAYSPVEERGIQATNYNPASLMIDWGQLKSQRAEPELSI